MQGVPLCAGPREGLTVNLSRTMSSIAVMWGGGRDARVGSGGTPRRSCYMSGDKRMVSGLLYLILAGVTVAAAIAVGLIYVGLPDLERQKLLMEVAKAFVELVAIGIVGAIVKLMLDEHQAGRRRREQ